VLVLDDGTLVQLATDQKKPRPGKRIRIRIFGQSTETIQDDINAVDECMRALQSKARATNDSVEGVHKSSTYSFSIKGFKGNLVYAPNEICVVNMESATLCLGHRAENEASAMNATEPVVLDYVPGLVHGSVVMVS